MTDTREVLARAVDRAVREMAIRPMQPSPAEVAAAVSTEILTALDAAGLAIVPKDEVQSPQMDPKLNPDEHRLAIEIIDAWSTSGLAETAEARRAKVAAKTALAALHAPLPTPPGSEG